MSGGPFDFAREALDLDKMLAGVGGEGWAGLESHFSPAKLPDRFEPDDVLKKALATMYRAGEGRLVLDWLLDLTVRAPPGASGNTLEAAALAHAKHEARFAVGQSLLLAIAQGEKLLNPPKEPRA